MSEEPIEGDEIMEDAGGIERDEDIELVGGEFDQSTGGDEYADDGERDLGAGGEEYADEGERVGDDERNLGDDSVEDAGGIEHAGGDEHDQGIEHVGNDESVSDVERGGRTEREQDAKDADDVKVAEDAEAIKKAKRAKHFASNRKAKDTRGSGENDGSPVDDGKKSTDVGANPSAADSAAPASDAVGNGDPAGEVPADESPDADESPVDSNIIPIDTIEPVRRTSNGPFVPRVLLDDPDTGDGSASREGVEVSSWRLQKLDSDRLGSMSDPEGTDRRSRKIRKVHNASRRARTDKRRAIRRWLRFAIGFLLVACVVAVAYVGISYVMEMWGGKTIPYVVGLSEGNAVAELEAKGFLVTLETIPADVLAGHVIESDPVGGLRVDEGTEVHLTVSTSRVVPEVVGMDREEAKATLEAAGAGNIRFEMQDTHDEENKVLEVRPAAGAVFMSTDEVTLVVSQLPRMINVVGEEAAIAMQHLEQAGITASTKYEQASGDQRMHVVRTVPAADEPIGDDNSVEVFVGDPLSDVAHLCDYFDSSALHTQDFLRSKGFERRVGHRTSEGKTVAGYSNGQEVVIGFVPEPWSHAESLEKGENTDVMTETAQIDGVRMKITVSKDTKKQTYGISNPAVSEATAQEVMRICGFQNMLGSCTQTNITLPSGTSNTGHVFYCCYGEQGTSVWTVLIKGASEGGKVVAKEIVATCAPKITYTAIDLSKHGDSICNYVAYQDEYK